MQWWCSASGKPWTWEPQIYPGVWLIMAVLALVFHVLSRRGRTMGESRLVYWSGWTAVGLVWQVLDWPSVEQDRAGGERFQAGDQP